MFKWLKRNKIVPNWSKKDSLEVLEETAPDYPYNIEFGDGRTKEEMDKMQKELNLKMMNAPFQECGCLPDCGCKEPTSYEEVQIDGC